MQRKVVKKIVKKSAPVAPASTTTTTTKKVVGASPTTKKVVRMVKKVVKKPSSEQAFQARLEREAVEIDNPKSMAFTNSNQVARQIVVPSEVVPGLSPFTGSNAEKRVQVQEMLPKIFERGYRKLRPNADDAEVAEMLKKFLGCDKKFEPDLPKYIAPEVFGYFMDSTGKATPFVTTVVKCQGKFVNLHIRILVWMKEFFKDSVRQFHDNFALSKRAEAVLLDSPKWETLMQNDIFLVETQRDDPDAPGQNRTYKVPFFIMQEIKKAKTDKTASQTKSSRAPRSAVRFERRPGVHLGLGNEFPGEHTDHGFKPSELLMYEAFMSDMEVLKMVENDAYALGFATAKRPAPTKAAPPSKTVKKAAPTKAVPPAAAPKPKVPPKSLPVTPRTAPRKPPVKSAPVAAPKAAAPKTITKKAPPKQESAVGTAPPSDSFAAMFSVPASLQPTKPKNTVLWMRKSGTAFDVMKQMYENNRGNSAAIKHAHTKTGLPNLLRGMKAEGVGLFDDFMRALNMCMKLDDAMPCLALLAYLFPTHEEKTDDGVQIAFHAPKAEREIKKFEVSPVLAEIIGMFTNDPKTVSFVNGAFMLYNFGTMDVARTMDAMTKHVGFHVMSLFAIAEDNQTK